MCITTRRYHLVKKFISLLIFQSRPKLNYLSLRVSCILVISGEFHLEAWVFASVYKRTFEMLRSIVGLPKRTENSLGKRVKMCLKPRESFQKMLNSGSIIIAFCIFKQSRQFLCVNFWTAPLIL